MGLQDKRPKGRQALNIEFNARKKCDYKTGARAWVPGPGPGPGPAQRGRHTCMGQLDLPGSIRLAWKEEKIRKKKEEQKEET